MPKISIAADFSRFPAGRYYSDGLQSGERFRKELLIPAFSSPGKVVIELDGTLGYGSSFLEEAFGGLVRHHGLNAEEIISRMELRSVEDPSLVQEILGNIRAAARVAGQSRI